MAYTSSARSATDIGDPDVRNLGRVADFSAQFLSPRSAGSWLAKDLACVAASIWVSRDAVNVNGH